MSQHGFIVFTATPEMAKQSNGALRSGVTYAAQRATVAAAPSSTKKVTKKSAKVAKKVTKKAAKKIAKKVTKKVAKKAKVKAQPAPKATPRKAVRPDAVVKFVRENDGCNMTDIERSVKLPQAALRRILNTARENGEITTTGQRRGLRYHITAPATATVGADVDSVGSETGDSD
ncbi:MAG: hypothetical protein AB7L09_03025 [Nitrospira sp.]